MKNYYIKPKLSIVDIAVEQGFATSVETEGENGNWVTTSSYNENYPEEY